MLSELSQPQLQSLALHQPPPSTTGIEQSQGGLQEYHMNIY